MRHLCTCFLFIILSISVVLTIDTNIVQGSITQNDIDDQPELLCKKNEHIELKYSPVGDLTSKSAKVWFEVYNNGSQPTTVDIIDRIDSINASTLNMLYGTPNPKKLEKFGNLTLIKWNDVSIDAGSRIEFQYLADSLKKIPVTVNETMMINGKPANITKAKKIYMVDANISDVITFQITVKNVAQKLISDKGYRDIDHPDEGFLYEVTPPLACIISASLSEDYFTNIQTEPETNSTSTMGERSMMTWYVFLEESSVTFSFSAKISKVSSWGEVPIEPISIQIASDPDVLEQQLEVGIDSLDASIELLEEFMNAMSDISEAYEGISSAVRYIGSAIGMVEEYEYSLVYALYAVGNGIKISCTSLDLSKSYLLNANESIQSFIQYMELDYPGLADYEYLYYAIGNITSAYMIIDQILPGLYEIYDSIHQISVALNSIGGALDQIGDGLTKLANGIGSASKSIRSAGWEMIEPIYELEDEKEDLEDLMLILEYNRMEPYDLEITNSDNPHSTDINFDIQLKNNWKIVKAEITNKESYAQIVYGLSIQIKSGNELVQPSAIEVQISPHIRGVQYSREWLTFDITELKQIGLEYDSESSTLYMWPMQRVNASSSENLLTDWMGRPLRIIVDSNSELDFIYEIDVADLPEYVRMQSKEGQTIFSMVQPHILAQNLTWVEPPPPLPPPKSWIEIILESLQRPEMHLLLITSIAIIIFLIGALYMRRRERKKLVEKKGVLLEKLKTSDLIREISEIERILHRDKEDFKTD